MDFILGTAGHIDHGKTSLVRALTGIDCDRLEEEKRRGITIELGFAWMTLPDGRRLGIVDVPGHERFIKNMVSGAAGVDCVLLVVAANEGVMPQTREHLDICSLLGVRSGLVALSKADLVDDELLSLARLEVAEALSGTFMANAPIIPVSSTTGRGIDILSAQIERQILNLQSVPKTDLFRLPIDRVFSMKGFGTVVTGTLISGSCMEGEKICVEPSGKVGRARGLQVHNQAVESAHSGQRCAINFQGFDVGNIERGDVAARPGTLFPSRRWFLHLHCLKSSPLPIRHRMEVHFHHGSRECLAKINLLECEKLEPGSSALAEVRFETPLPAVYGDRGVLRAHAPLRAVGGGVVICPLPPVLKKRDRDYAIKLALIKQLYQSVDPTDSSTALTASEHIVLISISLADAPGLDKSRLRVLTGLPDESLTSTLKSLEKSGLIFRWGEVDGGWISKSLLEKFREICRIRLTELHARDPLKFSFSIDELAAGIGASLPEKYIVAILEDALKSGILSRGNRGYCLPDHKISFDKTENKIIRILTEKIAAGGNSPPFIKEIAAQHGWNLKSIQPLLNHLCDSYQLVKIQDGLYYKSDQLTTMIERIREWFASNSELEVGDLKTLLGLSRKYSIPLLEYMDSAHITYRVNNVRRLWNRSL